MLVEVEDNQVLELVQQWHVEHVFFTNRIFNQLWLKSTLAHFRELGFDRSRVLLDNAHPLQNVWTPSFPWSKRLGWDVHQSYGKPWVWQGLCQKNGIKSYYWTKNKTHHQLMAERRNQSFVGSDNRHRRCLDFFTSYPFLVPLMVR